MMVGTDGTGEILDELRKENRTDDLRILHLSKSVGKKKAVEAASEIVGAKFMHLWTVIATWQLTL